jgi:hypothetical protein
VALLVIGGIDSTGRETDLIELISLDAKNNPVPAPLTINKFPTPLSLAGGAMLIQG